MNVVARWYDLRPNQLSAWRRMAKDGDLVLPAPEGEVEFAPLVVFDADSRPPAEDAEPAPSTIEIMAGSVAVRLDGATPAARIAEIVRAPGRHGENAETFLTGFNGILQIDGYQGCNRLTLPNRKGGEPIIVAHCWAHARRKLKEVFDRDGSEIAAEGLRRIAEIYAIEKDIRGTSPGQRLSARRARSAPLVAAFGDWLQAQSLRVSAKSRLGENLAYIHRHWDGLQTFLTDGRIEIDSNKVENLVRPILLNRKNALFAGHDEGGRAWGRIASLIGTAKVNGVEPFACLKSTLEAIAAGHSQNRVDDLLPWNFQPSS